MNYKLIACDLDGTLLNDDSTVSKENLAAIKKISENGILFVIVTGRTLFEIPKILLENENTDYIIYSDGAVAYSKKQKKDLLHKYIEPNIALQILEKLNEYETMPEIYADRRPFAEKNKLNEKSFSLYKIDENYRPVMLKTRVGADNLEELLKTGVGVELFNVFFKNDNERKECIDYFSRNENIVVTSSMTNNLEITRKDTKKGDTLRLLCATLGISSKEVIAIGDSKNDVTMLNFAGTALIPANADESVLEYADHRICSNNEGVADFVLRNYLEV